MQITRIMPGLRGATVPGTEESIAAEAVVTFADGEQQLASLAKSDLIRLIAQATDALARFEGVSTR